jgi:hypothetical protein
LLDAELLVEIYCELTGGRQRSLVFEEALESSALNAFSLPLRLEARRNKPTARDFADTAVHARYIETLGESAIWLRYYALASNLAG